MHIPFSPKKYPISHLVAIYGEVHVEAPVPQASQEYVVDFFPSVTTLLVKLAKPYYSQLEIHLSIAEAAH